MKCNNFFIVSTIIILSFGINACTTQQAVSNKPTTPPKDVAASHDHANHTKPKQAMPAYQSAMSLTNLPPTLPPEMFTGQVRAAYAVVKEIPEVIAQLPCYCHCDKSIGHKSLHTCYVDNHAEQCGICMNSALKAHKLTKEKKMTPAQIRQELAAEYGK